MVALRELLQRSMDKNGHLRRNHIEVVSVEKDHAILQLEIHPDIKNPYGIVHGGALYTLADDATAAAAVSSGQLYVTQDGSLHFVGNRSEGVITAEARVRHRGKSTCLVDVDITAEDGGLVATGTFTLFRVEKSIIK